MSETRPLIVGNQPINAMAGQQYGSYPTIGESTPQFGRLEDDAHFRLSPFKWLFIAVTFYCTLIPTPINISVLSSYTFSKGLTFTFDVAGWLGAIVFGLLLTRQHHHHGVSNFFASLTIILTIIMTVIASIISLTYVEIIALVWIVVSVSNFFVGGCVVLMTTLLGWNTNQRNSPFWFGLMGSIQSILAFNRRVLFRSSIGQAITTIALWCFAFVLFIWVFVSKLHNRSHVLIPINVNHGQRVIASNTLWLVYTGLGLLSAFNSLYDYVMTAGYLLSDTTLDNYFDFYKFNSISLVCTLLMSGVAIGLHQRWG